MSESSSVPTTAIHNPNDVTSQTRSHYRKPRSPRVLGGVLAFVGAAILVFSLKYFLFHAMTASDEYIGTRLWVVGSWLFGGGIALTIARPWIAALVGFVSPVLTFIVAMLLYFTLLFLGPMFL